jgi:hypothetical protein
MRSIEFDARLSDAVAQNAAKALVRQSLSHIFTKWFYAACIVNLVAFVGVALLLPGSSVKWFVGIIALGGPLYFLMARTVRPNKVAEHLKARLQPIVHVTLGDDTFTLSANGRSITSLWADVKSVIEAPDYFLLMTSRIGGAIIPRDGIPIEAQDMIRLHHPKSDATNQYQRAA